MKYKFTYEDREGHFSFRRAINNSIYTLTAKEAGGYSSNYYPYFDRDSFLMTEVYELFVPFLRERRNNILQEIKDISERILFNTKFKTLMFIQRFERKER